eukprot:COSAG06_NODE_1021_length_11055_cov_7.993976_4_plen_536_part_00
MGLRCLLAASLLAVVGSGSRPEKRGGGAPAAPPPLAPWHWRQQIHAIPSTAHRQDASGVVFTPDDGYWHVMPDCGGGYADAAGLSWCHQRSRDLLHWEEMPVVLSPDPSGKQHADPCLPIVAIDTGSVSILPDGRPFAIYATVNTSSTTGPRQVFDGNICLAIATNSSMTEWTRFGSIADNPTCSACSPACPDCTALHPKNKNDTTCAALPAREGCVSPLDHKEAMIPRFGFRDPTTPVLGPCTKGAQEQCWFVVIGSGSQTNRSAAGLLYRSQSSTDVKSKWSFVSVLVQENAGAPSDQYQYSCPDFFKLLDTWVWMSLLPSWNLGASSNANIYFLGSLDEATHKFVPSQHTPLFPASIGDYRRFGHTIAKSGSGPNGRRILWGAVCNLPGGGGPTGGIPNPKSRFANATETHHGCTMSLGQELRLAADRSSLEFHFLPELKALRRQSVSGAVGGRLLEIQANVTHSNSATRKPAAAGLSLFGGLVTLTHDPATHELAISGNATLADDGNRVAVPLTLAPGEQLRLSVYCDGSM